MHKPKFTIKRDTGDIELTEREISNIWSYYDCYLRIKTICDRLECQLKDEYNVNFNYDRYKDIVEDIAFRYEKNLRNGCDDEFSLNNAFDELSGAIRERMLSSQKETWRVCNRCGAKVYKSNDPEYAYKCFECYEDLYDYETSVAASREEINKKRRSHNE